MYNIQRIINYITCIFRFIFLSSKVSPKKYLIHNYYSSNKNKLNTKEKKDSTSVFAELLKIISAILANIKRIVFFDSLLYTLTALIEIFLFWKIFKRINAIIFCLIIGNILIFYSPIEKRCPKFLFRIRMFIKEIIEGILVVLSCLIPIGKKKN